ncbi:MAG: WG repeat-containing protein [Lutibacter sp.]|uniref:WG repeat-containing protein n=1 Tax=Lutibacter sp. TaxID=1925666 RepID=UPI0019EB5764|nr:WG repeat-containing protein [Lutibacter sp.]NOR28751.1 WG repeat-containing protein [Lutibacter sp.]
MKKLLIFIICLSIPSIGFSQILTDLEEVSILKDNLLAIKKDNKWGFINKEGALVIDFRDDFVLEKGKNNTPPFFNSDRCLIKKSNGNQYLYGYIDTSGKEVMKPQYLNASNFNNGYAIVITLLKDTVGYNEVLEKCITKSTLEEFVIDTYGNKVKYLENPRNCIPSNVTLKKPPSFHSKFIGPHLVAVLKKDNKWDIYEFQ